MRLNEIRLGEVRSEHVTLREVSLGKGDSMATAFGEDTTGKTANKCGGTFVATRGYTAIFVIIKQSNWPCQIQWNYNSVCANEMATEGIAPSCEAAAQGTTSSSESTTQTSATRDKGIANSNITCGATSTCDSTTPTSGSSSK